MNDGGDAAAKFFLAEASGWILVVLGEDLLELFRGDESIHLEEAIEIVVRLVEPELIEIEDAGFSAI